jgi:hypothetical protein
MLRAVPATTAPSGSGGSVRGWFERRKVRIPLLRWAYSANNRRTNALRWTAECVARETASCGLNSAGASRGRGECSIVVLSSVATDQPGAERPEASRRRFISAVTPGAWARARSRNRDASGPCSTVTNVTRFLKCGYKRNAIPQSGNRFVARRCYFRSRRRRMRNCPNHFKLPVWSDSHA